MRMEKAREVTKLEFQAVRRFLMQLISSCCCSFAGCCKKILKETFNKTKGKF